MEKVMDAWLEWLIKGIRDYSIPIILSTSISLFANKTFIQRGQEKRLHSETINDESFKEWLDKIGELCHIDMDYNLPGYSHEEKRIVPIKLQKLDLIPHNKYLESHMKTGYPEEWRYWEELREEIKKFNKQIADTLEYIRKEIQLECITLDLREHYHKSGRRGPRNYIRPDKLAVQIYKEINHRFSGYDHWMYGAIIKSFSMYGETKVFNLSIGDETRIMEYPTEKAIESVIDFIPKHVGDQIAISKINEIKKKNNELEEQIEEFKDKLEDIISNIDLSRSVKGKCSICSKLYRLARSFKR